MEPQVRYARTADGVNIAYYTMGSGPPFVWLMGPTTHLLAERRVPEMRAALDGTARLFTLVRLDPRGFGLSDREVTGFALEDMVRDVEAVMDKEGFESVVLLGIAIGSPIAVAYAARHPERVSHLILLGNARRGDRNVILDTLTDLAQIDWVLASETIIRSFYGRAGEDSGLADLLRESIDPLQLKEIGAQFGQSNANSLAQSLLESLRMPCLVLHDRSDRQADGPADRQVAAKIPDGRFAEIDSVWQSPLAIGRFLASTGGAPPAAAPSPAAAGGTAVILFADIADSTALTERLGDAAFREKARALDGSLRTIIREASGTPVDGKLLGDGVLGVFTSGRQAIEAALACAAAGEAGGLPLHLGLHAGDVIEEDGNVFGGAVNIAARVASASAPGEVLVSGTVRDLARTSAGVTFDDHGDHEFKGVSEPVRVWRVRSE